MPHFSIFTFKEKLTPLLPPLPITEVMVKGQGDREGGLRLISDGGELQQPGLIAGLMRTAD